VETILANENPVADVAREFIAYYKRGGGCSNCGGLPHADSCFVGRFEAAFNQTITSRPGGAAPGEPK